MTMKAAFIFATIFASIATTGICYAETFQWKDGNGQTVISDTPPPTSAKGRRSIGGTKPAVVSEATADKPAEVPKADDTPKSIADKDLEFKKRRQEAKEKAEKQAKAQAAESEKRANCETAQRNLTTLESNRPVTVYDKNGEVKLMDTTERDQEMERARQFMAESCK